MHAYETTTQHPKTHQRANNCPFHVHYNAAHTLTRTHVLPRDPSTGHSPGQAGTVRQGCPLGSSVDLGVV